MCFGFKLGEGSVSTISYCHDLIQIPDSVLSSGRELELSLAPVREFVGLLHCNPCPPKLTSVVLLVVII